MAWSDAARAAAAEARKRRAGVNSSKRYGAEGAAVRSKQASYLRTFRDANKYGYMGAKPGGQVTINKLYNIHAAYAAGSKTDRVALNAAAKRIRAYQAAKKK
jgi:hypothetical protein